MVANIPLGRHVGNIKCDDFKQNLVIPIVEYNNPVRMAKVLNSLKKDTDLFHFVCIEGMVSFNRGELVVKEFPAVVLVSFLAEDKNAKMSLMVCGATASLHGKTEIDLRELPKMNIAKYLIKQIIRKASKTKSWRIVAEMDAGYSIIITGSWDTAEGISTDDKACVTKLEIWKDGDKAGVTCNEHTIASTLDMVTKITQFSFTMVDNVGKPVKEVTVNNNQVEMYREISRYLNKTIVLVSLDEENGKIIEQHISATSAVEISIKMERQTYYKHKPLMQLANTEPFCAFLSSASVDDVVSEHGRALSRTGSGARR